MSVYILPLQAVFGGSFLSPQMEDNLLILPESVFAVTQYLARKD